MKKLVLTLAALAFSASTVFAQDVVRMGTEGAYPPFNTIGTDGVLSGFDIDIAKALCEEMKAECTFVTQDWDGIIPALLAGKFDAIIASMSITDERDQVIDFTAPYIPPSPSAYLALTGADVDLGGVRTQFDRVTGQLV